MQISLNNTHPKWVECTHLPDMDYQDLSNDEFACECAQNPCAEAWEEFVRRFNRLIGTVVRRACRDWGEIRQEVIDDLIQETYLKFCANRCAVLMRFQPRHENSFLGYLKVVTANVVYDYFRKVKPGEEKTGELPPGIIAPQSTNSEDEIFFKKVDKILRERGDGPQEQKERTIFWLYYRVGMTCKEIACVPAINLTVKGVESCIFRLIVYIKRRFRGPDLGPDPGGNRPPGSF